MNKTWLIIEREYLTRVKKKSFLITTLVVPVVIIAFYAVIIMISISGETSTQKVAVIDDANLFNGKIEETPGSKISFALVQDNAEAFKHQYKTLGYNLLVYIPVGFDKDSSQVKVYSQSSIALSTKNDLEKKISYSLEAKRLAQANIDPELYKKIKADISIQNVVDSGSGEQKGSAGVAYAVSFIAGILIYMILIIYGTMVMRGIMEEKTNRIAEVIVSSVKPFQLMLGKIVGIGAVGITQFIIWIVLMFSLQMLIPLLFPGMFHQLSDPAVANAIHQNENISKVQQVVESINTLPIGLIIGCFIFYFFGGYLLYASLFGAIGSVVSEDQQESQQLVLPIMMPLILGFVIMTKAVNDPDSALAVFGSLFPLTSPIVMLARVTYGVPWWQLVLSMGLLVATFIFFTWIAAKIYRTGILMYGKKITWKEMFKWLFIKN